MTTLWCTAEAWGFGPASKLLAVTDGLTSRAPWLEQRFFADGSCRQLIGGLHPCAGRSELLALLGGPESRDVVLFNVMDADVQLAAAVQGVPCIYLDSLVHLWALMEEYGLAYYDRLAESLLAAVGRAAPPLTLLNPYDKHWLAHLLSDASLYQSLAPFEGFRQELLEHVGAKACGLVVDGRLKREAGSKEAPTVLVNVGGRPRDPESVEGAVDGVLLALGEAVDEFRVVVCGADASLARLAPDDFELVSDRSDYLAAFAECDLVVAVPGLTTMCEALATGCPCVVVPPSVVGGWRFSEQRHVELVGSWQESCMQASNVAVARSRSELGTLITGALAERSNPGAGTRTVGVETGVGACVAAILAQVETGGGRSSAFEAGSTKGGSR
jgi:hypothetical protein